jgi:ATP synthase F1 delta subunit
VLGKKRVDQIPGILEKFHDLSRAHRGIVRARVRTAVTLEPALEEQLKAKLGRMTGKTIEVESRVDPEILGGVVVEFENQIIDRSVRRGLDDLRDSLMKVRVL